MESFFGQQRQRGGGSDNPHVLQFIYTTSSIRAHKAITPAVRGNVRGSKHHEESRESLETPLPKRPMKPTQSTRNFSPILIYIFWYIQVYMFVCHAITDPTWSGGTTYGSHVCMVRDRL